MHLTLSSRVRSSLPLAVVCVAHGALAYGLLPGWMFAKYPDGARLLREGRLGPELGADFSPLYLLLNVAFPPAALHALQVVAGGAGLLAVASLGARWHSRAAGVLGAALLGACTPYLLYEATLEPDLLVAVCTAGALAALAVPAGQHTRGRLLGAGVLTGLSAALRPTGLGYALLWALWLLLARGGGPWRARAGRAALLLGVCAAVSALPVWAVRAWAGSRVGATMSAGAVVHMGNRPEGTGLGAQPPWLMKRYEQQLRSSDRPDYAHQLYRDFARAELGAAPDPVRAERFWLEKALSFVREHPLAWLRLLGRKLAFFLAGMDGHDLVEVRRAQGALEALPVPPLGARWLTLLGLGGLAGALLGRVRGLGPGLLHLGASLALALGFYVVSRYRLGALPVWAALAGAQVCHVWAARAELRVLAARLAPLAAALLVPLALPHLRHVEALLERGDRVRTAGADLEAARAAGRYDEAARAYVQLQAANPAVALLRPLRGVPFESEVLARASGAWAAEHLDAEDDTPAALWAGAELARRAGRCDLAEAPAREAAARGFYGVLFDAPLDPRLLQARCALQAGRREDALAAAHASLEARPGAREALAFAAAGAEALGRDDEARGLAEQLLRLHDLLGARHARGEARLEWGLAAGALEDADAVLAAVPDLALAHHLRARALARTGRVEPALKAYVAALGGAPAHAFPTRPLDGAVEAGLARAPRDPGMLALGAEHHLRAGRLERARDLARRALALAPADAGLAALARELEAARPSGVPVPPPPVPSAPSAAPESR